MLITKIAGIACSFADIAFILMLLKASDIAKGPKHPRPKKRLAVLYVFALLTPTLALPLESDMFLIWQSLILGFPYLILAYSIVAELPVILRYVRPAIREKLRRRAN